MNTFLQIGVFLVVLYLLLKAFSVMIFPLFKVALFAGLAVMVYSLGVIFGVI